MSNTTEAINKFQITVKVTDTLIQEIFENSNIDYWGEFENGYRDNKDTLGWSIFDHVEGEYNHFHDANVVKGLRKLVRDYINGTYVEYNPFPILNDISNYESGFGDHVLQYTIFGELVYG
jgi:hypothetical protein